MFAPAKMKWKGEDIVIPPHQIMTAIAAVEEHITIAELARYAQRRGTTPFARVAQGFVAALAVVGREVDPREVYQGLLKGSEDEIGTSVMRLLALMSPSEDVVGNAESPERRLTPGAGRPSKRRSK